MNLNNFVKQKSCKEKRFVQKKAFFSSKQYYLKTLYCKSLKLIILETWSPANQDGERVYERSFLLQFAGESTTKPEDCAKKFPDIFVDTVCILQFKLFFHILQMYSHKYLENR